MDPALAHRVVDALMADLIVSEVEQGEGEPTEEWVAETRARWYQIAEAL